MKTLLMAVVCTTMGYSVLDAQTPSPDSARAKQTLTTAQKTVDALRSFSAEIVNDSETDSSSQTIRFFSKKAPDGITESRVEIIKQKNTPPQQQDQDKKPNPSDGKKNNSNNKNKKPAEPKKKAVPPPMPTGSITITNREGTWALIGDTAIRMVFAEDSEKKVVKDDSQKSDDETYTISDGTMSGKPCYVVAATLSPAKYDELSAAASSTEPPLPVIYRKIYHIGKTDNFIYSTAEYDKKGNKLSSLTYQNVQLNATLSDDLFRIPKNCKLVKAETEDQYIAAFSDIISAGTAKKK